jgi:3-phytase
VTTASLPGDDAGILIAQHGDNTPAAQNFKLIRWADGKRALNLP